MERDGNQPSKLPMSSSAGLLITSNGAPTSRLPVRRPPRGSFPLSSPAVNDRNGAGSSGGNSKGKAVNHNSPNNNNSTNSRNVNTDNSNNKNKGKSGGTSGGNARGSEGRREQDMYMPITNVVRIMRQVLPLNVKIADDAKDTIQECVSEYISFVTGEANERCRQEQRKTITAEDLLYAMCKLGFEDYIGPLTVFLQRYRAADGEARGSLRGTARGEPYSPVKRNATDAGLFMLQNHEQEYTLLPAQSSPANTMAHSCLPLYPLLQGAPAFFPGAGGSSFAAGVQGLLRPPTPMPMGPGAPIPLPPTVPIPLLPLPPMTLLPPPPVPLNYYRQEALANNHMTAEANPDATLYREIARAPTPGTPYGDVPIYGDLGGHNDLAESPSSSDDAGPSQQAFFPDFEPFALYK
ncbi:hypothetical protein Taro_027785 [Colocasia esculenta]|uniref:Transcription factor CBF/NF-Y/archaeal histone domain-containing protein n=1 Tax=Colocasia esculenta TaxID=4460 RepID=A0A843VES7_COLES|nr:hypothetical protein [Colocasia esculenta]